MKCSKSVKLETKYKTMEKINSPRRYEQYYPRLSKPAIVGYMSVDEKREYHADLSELKYITRIPKETVSFDLNHNIDKAIKRTTDENEEKLDLLLKFLLDQNDRIQCVSPSPHFIMYRRTMISVFSSAMGLERSCIVGSLFNGTIYLCSMEHPENDRKKFTEEVLKYCAWGYKFEQYMNADLPGLMPDIEKPVVENAEFSLYLLARFGDHRLLYGAQIDGMLATNGEVSNPPQNADYETNLEYLRSNSYAELKTNKEIQHWKQENILKRNKMLKCWAQCYLGGLKGLVIGYRTQSGIVTKLECFDTEAIVNYCQGFWSEEEVLRFLDHFLKFVKHSLVNHARTTYGDNCDLKNIGPVTLQFDIDTNRAITFTDKCQPILPDWFVEAKKKRV